MAHDELPHDLLLQRLTAMACAALPRYGLPPDSAVTLLNHSENTTFRIDPPRGADPRVLRIHRTNYQTPAAIRSELHWMQALRDDAGITTPTPIPGPDGRLVQQLEAPGIQSRRAVLFDFLPGHQPDESDLLSPFRRLGAIAARMHAHAVSWQRPPGFERLRWDHAHMLGARPNWGDWRAGPALGPARLALLDRLSATLRRRLDAYGADPGRFGLIHADLRLANLLLDGDQTYVIDFDDAGFGWFLYDLATALSFMEERPDVPELVAAWLEGYCSLRPLSQDDEREIPTFLMLRRLLVLAWIGSHAATDLARDLGPQYTAGTCRLARDYLRTFDRTGDGNA